MCTYTSKYGITIDAIVSLFLTLTKISTLSPTAITITSSTTSTLQILLLLIKIVMGMTVKMTF